jgi:endoglucanase
MLVFAGLVSIFLFPIGLSAQTTTANATDLGKISSVEVVRQMGLGWNLGNTMECAGDWINKGAVHNFETAWGNPDTTKEMIDAIKDAGFKSIRIPVAWSNMMGDNYTINPALLERVKQIVDWALDDGMIAIINIHWDGGWWSKFPVEYDKSMKRYTGMWSQIAGYFKDEPDSLIFESLNEEGCFGDVWNRYGGENPTQRQKAYGILNDINQAFVDLVRKSGGKNAQRHLLIAGYCTDIDLTTDADFLMPKDPQNHCVVSVHYYTPYTFAGLEKDESWGKARPTWGKKEDYDELESNMQKLKVHFLDKGVPVIVGEYGATLKAKDPESVRRYILAVAQKVYRMGMCPMLWDPGQHFNRKTLVFNDPELLDGFQKIERGIRTAEGEYDKDQDAPAAMNDSIPADILREAKKDTASPEGIEYEKQFSSKIGDDLMGFMRVCTLETAQTKDFTIVLKIEKSGNITAVYTGPKDPVAACVAGKLSNEKCPKPPFAPYYELVDMRMKD